MAQPVKTQPRTQAPPPPTSRGQVAVIAPPRLMVPSEDVLKRYGIDEQGWRTLVETTFPAAKTPAAVVMALDYCQHRKLDILKKPVHIVPVYSSQANNGQGGMVETIWPGINEIRTTAIRTGQYAGMDVPTFGPLINQHFKGKVKKNGQGGAQWEEVEADVAFPEWCQITVYRTLGGNRVPFPGPRVYWLETYATLSRWCDVPNSMWQDRPNGQLEKCAEAAALRRAFPEELGSDYSIDEIGAFTTHAPADVTDEGSATTAPPEPKRADFETPPQAAQGVQGGGEGQADATVSSADGGKPASDSGASGQPALTITDVVDENDLPPPEHAQPGQKLKFAKFDKLKDLAAFAEDFLAKTNEEGARQFETFYAESLLRMEKLGPNAKAWVGWCREQLLEIAPPREPGEEG